MSKVGHLVPLVMIPRFTSYFGTSDEFKTVALDVSRYSSARLTLWRGDVLDSGTFKLYTETSHDGYTWFTDPSAGYDTTGPGASKTIDVDFPRRYFRVRVKLTGGSPGVTCWCEGMLEYRIDE